MKKLIIVAISLVVSVSASPSFASECWRVDAMKGYSAMSNEDYRFVENGIGQPMIVCFAEGGGTASGLDVPLVKFGNSTLAGYGGNDLGNEMFVVYQLDRERRKMLFMQSRIGTHTVVPLLPDVVHAFVGDAVPVN